NPPVKGLLYFTLGIDALTLNEGMMIKLQP
ncbi:MAG: hypothetical protein H6Q99_632, partial [Proteobacteria bacterium]|nr:hypothetical protein [Pseudomonadota bacterium]